MKLLLWILIYLPCGLVITGCASKLPMGASEAAAESQTGSAQSSNSGNSLSAPTIELADPTNVEPVLAAMAVAPGAKPSELEVWVRVRIADGYYVHAYDENYPDFKPLAVQLELPDGVTATGDWKFPTPEIEHDFPVYRNEVLIRRTLQVNNIAGPLSISATVEQQACTANTCQAPGTITLSQVVQH